MAGVRSFLLFAHVAGAILFLGPTTMATSRFARHAAAGDLAEAVELRRTSRAYGTASIVVPGVGFALTDRIDGFGLAWVQAAIGLFLVGALLLGAVHLPAQAAALGALREGAAVPRGVLGRLRASAGAYALSWVGIVWLMIDKPV